MIITYKEYIKVYLDKKLIGEIKKVTDGFQYFPKGSKIGGKVFSTLIGCKISL